MIENFEFDFLKAFWAGANIGKEDDRAMGRALWMAYCRHQGIRKNGSTYESKLRHLYRNVKMPGYATYEGFASFMGEHL